MCIRARAERLKRGLHSGPLPTHTRISRGNGLHLLRIGQISRGTAGTMLSSYDAFAVRLQTSHVRPSRVNVQHAH